MDAIEIRLDSVLFSADVVARTAYRYTVDFYTTVETDESSVVVRLVPRSRTVDVNHISERFQTDALDERMREQIRAETTDLHAALVQAALSQALPPNSKSESSA